MKLPPHHEPGHRYFSTDNGRPSWLFPNRRPASALLPQYWAQKAYGCEPVSKHKLAFLAEKGECCIFLIMPWLGTSNGWSRPPVKNDFFWLKRYDCSRYYDLSLVLVVVLKRTDCFLIEQRPAAGRQAGRLNLRIRRGCGPAS